MFVIVGLGNPGKKYDGTRHNVGFDAINYLAHENNIAMNKVKHKAVIGEGFIHHKKVLLVKPQTFMNLSGQSVMEILNYYKIDPSELVVLYDDIDIDVGKLRVRKKGSAGTHNGMKSIIYDIQSDDFPRIRIGVGKPERGNLADYVLGRFAKEDREFIDMVIKKSAEAVETMVKEGIDMAMNQYNG